MRCRGHACDGWNFGKLPTRTTPKRRARLPDPCCAFWHAVDRIGALVATWHGAVHPFRLSVLQRCALRSDLARLLRSSGCSFCPRKTAMASLDRCASRLRAGASRCAAISAKGHAVSGSRQNRRAAGPTAPVLRCACCVRCCALTSLLGALQLPQRSGAFAVAGVFNSHGPAAAPGASRLRSHCTRAALTPCTRSSRLLRPQPPPQRRRQLLLQLHHRRLLPAPATWTPRAQSPTK